MEKVNLLDKLAKFSNVWQPKIIGELNEQYVKLVKLEGDFVWHKHENEDELFYVIEGELIMELEYDKKVIILPGELFIVPKGVVHRPIAKVKTSVMLFEPKETINTGDDLKSHLTHKQLEWI